MHTVIDQNDIDARIHRFMARKSPLKTLSKTIADHLVTLKSHGHDGMGISYEQTRWEGGRSANSR